MFDSRVFPRQTYTCVIALCYRTVRKCVMRLVLAVMVFIGSYRRIRGFCNALVSKNESREDGTQQLHPAMDLEHLVR